MATTSVAGNNAAIDITYPFFSTPMNSTSFHANIKAALALPRPIHHTEGLHTSETGPSSSLTAVAAAGGRRNALRSAAATTHPAIPPAKRFRRPLATAAASSGGGGSSSASAFPTVPWGVHSIADDVYQVGPWFADVRQVSSGTARPYNNIIYIYRTAASCSCNPFSAVALQSSFGENIVMRSGEHELKRYLTFARAASGPDDGCASCAAAGLEPETIYGKKMPAPGKDPPEAFGWLCNMTVVRLPAGGCVVYSPVLGADNTIAPVLEALREHALLPVRIVIAPSPQHHFALSDYQAAFPQALLFCGKASSQVSETGYFNTASASIWSNGQY